MNANKQGGLLNAVIGGILLWGAWPTSPLTILIFIAWVPLLYTAESAGSWARFFGYTYITTLLWNVLVTWWVAKASVPGGIGAFAANSLLMCVPWLAYYFTRKQFNAFVSGLALIAYWLTFEFIHMNWDLSWPWLSLGNVFAMHPNWVQWYEYTGTAGGSLWVLLSNILVFNVLLRYREEGRSTGYFKLAAAWVLTLCVPILLSAFTKQNLTLQHNKYNVVVVQPDYDPWDDKFVAGKEEEHLHKLIRLSQQNIDANTAVVIWPETAVPYTVREDQLHENRFLVPLWAFLKNNPHINLLTGLEGYRLYPVRPSRFATKLPDGSFAESYNSAALFDSNSVQIYHKSKLVPGPEVLPGFISFLAPLFEKFGGTMGGYTKDSTEKVLQTSNNTFSIAPAICYESIYGDHLSRFNRKGTNLIAVITNDGWWGNTQGYRQHMQYARLRAIESRKWVARSANTGISCFIDPYGNITRQLPWNRQGVLKQTVAAFVTETFYTKHGDWISKIAAVIAVLFLLFLVYRIFAKKTSSPLKSP
ncbi:apolipoprotein N-acyltransferase [Niabella ginsenosidivorans]|uniref:Apolipoprotein N-acyltransferase n=1 Tax=Niabella ginsenosidivorans TaxID=1176587 RepID=A0A1A9I016_9BACT|nr:apolipoprotein N-acyltransferase [Niabella ginsenosidivorans]ANH79894.1 apolipoprotein N-acyltransferase [Niabella ginsenosidivorans]